MQFSRQTRFGGGEKQGHTNGESRAGEAGWPLDPVLRSDRNEPSQVRGLDSVGARGVRTVAASAGPCRI
jgi:hypothetical protein